MQDTTAQHEQMPNRVHITRTFHAIEDDADSIAKPTAEHQPKAQSSSICQDGFNSSHDRPTH